MKNYSLNRKYSLKHKECVRMASEPAYLFVCVCVREKEKEKRSTETIVIK